MFVSAWRWKNMKWMIDYDFTSYISLVKLDKMVCIGELNGCLSSSLGMVSEGMSKYAFLITIWPEKIQSNTALKTELIWEIWHNTSTNHMRKKKKSRFWDLLSHFDDKLFCEIYKWLLQQHNPQSDFSPLWND